MCLDILPSQQWFFLNPPCLLGQCTHSAGHTPFPETPRSHWHLQSQPTLGLLHASPVWMCMSHPAQWGPELSTVAVCSFSPLLHPVFLRNSFMVWLCGPHHAGQGLKCAQAVDAVGLLCQASPVPSSRTAARSWGSSVWSPRQPKAEERLQNGRLGYGCLDISSFLEDRTLQTRFAQRRHPTGSLGLACGRRPSTFSFFWFVCWASLCTAKQMVVCFWLSFPAVWMWTVEFCLLKLQFVFLFWLHWIFRLFLGRVEHVYKIDIVKTSLSNVLFLWIQYII